MPHTIIADVPSYESLAVLPTQGGYFSVVKIILFLLMVILWAHNSAWVQADTKKIRVPKGLWVFAVFGTGLLCLLIWFLVPLFWVGFAVFAILYGAAILSYVLFRNRRVAPAQTVLTPAHLRRLTTQDSGSKRDRAEAAHVRDRARIKDYQDKTPPWPTDPDEHAGYQGLQDLLFDAIWRRASDARLDFVAEQPVSVIYRVDGVDRAREPIDSHLGPYILTHIKRISGMDPDERRRPQTGHFNATIGAGGSADKSVDVEAKASGSTSGQRVLLRLIAEEAKFRPPDLGLTQDQLPVFEKVLAQPKGVVICSGPRGSGVTSTLYAILRTHDAFMQNIHTIEITKAMDLENITQHVFDDQDGATTFGKRFRSLIRTEPDVAMAGDAPDAETLAYAAAAGRQNKKIYLGMTAKDTFSALRRYLQGVGDNALAASSLVAITSQRLVRILCGECRRAYKPDPALLKKGNLPTGENRPFYRPPNPNEVEVDKQGNQLICPVCQGSGYLGRTGVFEILIISDHLRALLAKGTDLQTLKAEARKKGMLYLQEIALHKVYDGITSINEVLRVTKESKREKK
ncbi:MAG: Flp pilus assembly complex ATPase component TadA [Phycisphaerae bacterium]|nr:Flp pilus assembly complex ATPase component TadA [Phycisphaerae bacterium]